jgi:hypothetical protein
MAEIDSKIRFALTDKGSIVKFKFTPAETEVEDGPVNYIENVRVLDLSSSCFSLEYAKKYGNISINTITEDPKEIFTALNKTKTFFEKRELALMNNLFIVNDGSDKEILENIDDDTDDIELN